MAPRRRIGAGRGREMKLLFPCFSVILKDALERFFLLFFCGMADSIVLRFDTVSFEYSHKKPVLDE